ncbi:MAG: hypothetical protein WC551_09980 [Patescibacteria group bacterium]
MPISEATIRAVKYPPEKIPDSWFGNVPANSEVSPPVIDLKRFSPYLCTLSDIQLPANANVELRARYGKTRVNENTAAMLNALPGAWRLMAKDELYLNFFGLAPAANYTSHYGLWVVAPTVAHKLALGMPLTGAEMELAARLNIQDSVDKGVLPLAIRYQIEREYMVLEEETHARSVNIAAANVTYTIESLYPRPGEIVVLTRIAANPGAAANAIRFIVDRDQDIGYADVRTFPLSLMAGGEVECFIPAMKEIRLTCQAAVAPGAHLFRYTFRRIRLNNILRARFGLASKDELPGDVWEKCIAGVL